MRIAHRIRLLAGVLTLGLAAGCGGATVDTGTGTGTASAAPSAGGTQASAGGTVKIAVNPWAGYEASAAVIAHLLEEKLGYTVEKKELAEQVSWEGFENGDVDVIVENWGHEDLKKTFIEDKKVAVEAAPPGTRASSAGTSPSGWRTSIPASPTTRT
nr:hypothetical protein GCM10020093_099270 [Planobispora longispora]